jgi:hypothetical protein
LIRINGHLGATLLSAFPVMAWERQGPETVLTGVLDQPGLYGVLAEIEALGLDLLEVRRLPPGARSPEHGDTCAPLPDFGDSPAGGLAPARPAGS